MHLVSPIDRGCSAHHLHPGYVAEICTACENCTKDDFTLGLLYAYYMVKAGIFGIFTDRLYFLEKIQTIEIITDVMQV